MFLDIMKDEIIPWLEGIDICINLNASEKLEPKEANVTMYVCGSIRVYFIVNKFPRAFEFTVFCSIPIPYNTIIYNLCSTNGRCVHWPVSFLRGDAHRSCKAGLGGKP